jgi:hypothetical protein
LNAQQPPRLTALRLLVDPDGVDLDHLDWAELRRIAERTGVIVRLADALKRHGEVLPPEFAAAAARACAQAQRVFEVVELVGHQCTRLGVPHAFLKVAEWYPDSGPDIDVLIGEYSPAVDRLILGAVPAAALPPAVRSRIVGSRSYQAAHGIVVDIHHGRVGQVGEQARFARLLLSRAAPVSAGTTRFTAPTPADHFLLLVMQRLYTWPAFRLADVSGVIAALRTPGAGADPWSWDYVFATALSMGLVPAVGAYLEYIDRMYARLYDRSLIPESLLTRFQTGAPAPQDDERYPRTPLARRLYLRQFQATVEAGRWNSAARLSLLPLMALAAGGRKLTRRNA